VDDTQAALWQWAAWRREQFDGTVIAVTGSVGKTTTRQMIDTILRARLRGTASPANYNNHWGVPLSMSAIRLDDDYAVLELGANRPGEIARLADLCRPRIGVITQIGDAHLGGFGSRQGIARAKAELLDTLPEDGHAVLGDDPWLRRVVGRGPAGVSWIGPHAANDLTAHDIHTHDGHLSFCVDQCHFTVPVWGRHHVTAALAAIGVGRLMGFTLQEMADLLEDFRGVPMRCQVQHVREAMVINDAYNANPTSMRAALEMLRDVEARGRRVAVLGDMGELGDEAPKLHWQLGKQVVGIANADLLIACGRYARHIVGGARGAGMPAAHAIPCETIDEAPPYLGQAILPGDVVLVKGSRMMQMERLVEALDHYPARRSA
jgi:UDP-N-acetylmuramoyl-tripeptide--D-alanyl-D-alanine ligase